ncbi:hypothetical protein HDU97_009699 [Phlyctochytrium planicorne]|nr:hypothetical protein HDU97_009699 [Phlyctochytrium planicorne]
MNTNEDEVVFSTEVVGKIRAIYQEVTGTKLSKEDRAEIAATLANPNQKCSRVKKYLQQYASILCLDEIAIYELVNIWAAEQAEWEDYLAGDGGRSTSDPEIRDNIRDLVTEFDHLQKNYRILDRIGQGTFSLVYKAVDKWHDRFENTWCQCGDHDGNRIENKATVCGMVAIKVLFRTASTERIYTEINTLNEVRLVSATYLIFTPQAGNRMLLQCSVYIDVMGRLPFYVTDKFENELEDDAVTMDEIRCYLRCLFIALKHVHEILGLRSMNIKAVTILRTQVQICLDNRICNFYRFEKYKIGILQT